MDSSYRLAVRCLSLGILFLIALAGFLSWAGKDTGFFAIAFPTTCTGLLGLLVPNRAAQSVDN